MDFLAHALEQCAAEVHLRLYSLAAYKHINQA